MRKTISDARVAKRLRALVVQASKNPQHGKQRVACEIWTADGVERVAWGRNRPGAMPMHRAHYNPEVIGVHAEVDAVDRVHPLERRELVMLVARSRKLRRGGPVVAGNAKPCDSCFDYAATRGVSNVFWTLDQEDPREPISFGTENAGWK